MFHNGEIATFQQYKSRNKYFGNTLEIKNRNKNKSMTNPIHMYISSDHIAHGRYCTLGLIDSLKGPFYFYLSIFSSICM